MRSALRLTVVALVLSMLAWLDPVTPAFEATGLAAAPDAAASGEQAKPPAQAKPAEQAKPPADATADEDLPADFKAFNEAAREKDVQKRIAAFEAFISAHPESVLVPTARTQMHSSLRSGFTSARSKYLESIKGQVEEARKREAPIHSTYARFATELMNAGLLEEAEQYARDGLASMNEQKYIEMRRQAAEKIAAAAANPQPAAGPGYTLRSVGGVMTASLARPAAAPAASTAPSTPPPVPTDDQLRRSFTVERAGLLSTLGQVLVKRGQPDEGEKMLEEAYAAKPASSAVATIARLLAESAKKKGNEKAQVEYLMALALSGRITAAERNDLVSLYKKTNGGTAADLEDVLDERYRRETPKYVDVTPYTRPARAGQRVVLAEIFAGAG